MKININTTEVEPIEIKTIEHSKSEPWYRGKSGGF